MSTLQRGDILFGTSGDGGEIEITDGLVEMTQAYETAIYLALAGGNIEDTATADTDKKQWMGNEDEPAEYRVRSRFISAATGRKFTSETIKELAELAALDILDALGSHIKSVACGAYATGKNTVLVKSQLVTKDGQQIRIQSEIPIQ